MSASTILYNLLMLGVDAGALLLLRQRREPFNILHVLTLCGVGALAGFAAFPFAEDSFGLLRFLAYGFFLHGGIMLAGLGAVLWGPSRKPAIVAASLAGLLAIVAMDAFLIEPAWLEVSRVRIESPKVTKPVKIVVLADLQTDVIGAYEKKVLSRTMKEKPELILLVGDYVQEYDPVRRDALRAELSGALREAKLAAPMGVYAVGGNIDPPDWPMIFAPLDVKVVSRTQSFDLEGMRVTGLALADASNVYLEIGPSEKFHVVMGHTPNFALGEVQADLLVAGHTHGGQVRIPFFGPIFTFSAVPRGWAAGVTKLDGGRTLVVSRGVGHERGHAPRLRFWCRPELVVIDVVPSKQNERE